MSMPAALGWVMVNAAERGLTGLGRLPGLRCAMACSIIEVGQKVAPPRVRRLAHSLKRDIEGPQLMKTTAPAIHQCR